MTQEDKQLLLADLCARMPYGIICDCLHSIQSKATIIDVENMMVYYTDCDEWESIEYCKPYLRPMSSMTGDEKEEYNKVMFQSERYENDYAADIDWLNAHHFDYRGLIEKGLAIEAPKGMYGKEEQQ